MSTKKPKDAAAQADSAEDATDAKPAAKAPWKHPDYVGPLDAQQAAWRNLHLKRLERADKAESAAKAANGAETK